jgi:predicted alpha/beta superfamily hydrolase
MIHGSECHVLSSATTGRDYEVSVWRPAGVAGPLPLLLVTDGNLCFPMATSIVPLMVVGAEMPAVHVVGIGYPTNGDVGAVLELRDLDLIPVRADPSLGAEAFIAFIRDELFPWLEHRDEINDDRTLYGDSLGGLFSLHVLLHHSSLFRRYIAVSPAVVADPGFYGDAAWEAVNPENGPDIVVSLSAGELEADLSPALGPELTAAFASLDTVNHTRRVDDRLRTLSWSHLRLTTTIVPAQSHFTMPAIGMASGLREVFG